MSDIILLSTYYRYMLEPKSLIKIAIGTVDMFSPSLSVAAAVVVLTSEWYDVFIKKSKRSYNVII